LGTPYNDVDIFIYYKSRSKVLQLLRDVMRIPLHFRGDEYTDFENTMDGVYEGGYEGFRFQFIFSKHGANAPDTFDIGFRKWTYDGETVYAYDAALSDINQREVNIHNAWDLFKTMDRALRFADKYNYRITSKSEEVIFGWALIQMNLKPQAQSYAVRSMMGDRATRFMAWVDQIIAAFGAEEVADKRWFIAANIRFFTAELALKAWHTQAKDLLAQNITIKENVYLLEIEKLVAEISSIVRRNRTKLLFSSELLPFLDNWNKHLSNSIFIMTALKSHVETLTTKGRASYSEDEVLVLLEMKTKFDQIEKLAPAAARFKQSYEVRVSTFNKSVRVKSESELRQILDGEQNTLFIDGKDYPYPINEGDRLNDPLYLAVAQEVGKRLTKQPVM
jgi:hypothetical protein